MELQIQDLVTSIRKEGVEAANAEAESIIAEAKKKADSIVASAKAEAQQVRDASEKEIAILDSQIKAITTKSANAINHLSLIRKKVDARKELVAESDREISGLTSAISSKEKDIKAMQARLDTLSDYYERLVRGAYKNRNPKVWYMYILASDNLGQAFRRYGYLRDLSKQMNIQAEKILAAKDTLEREREALAALKKDAETLRGQRLADMGKLQAEQNDSQKLVNQLKRDKKKYQQDLSKKQKEVEALCRAGGKVMTLGRRILGR